MPLEYPVVSCGPLIAGQACLSKDSIHTFFPPRDMAVTSIFH